MSSTDLEKSVECPVCLDVFRQPKSLPCGHCVCEACVTLAGGLRVTCPVCRVESDVPPNGFPTNYTVVAVVEQLNSASAAAKRKCVTCAGSFLANEVYVCGDCAHRIYCSHCAIDAHGPHQLTKLTAAMQKHSDDKAAWKGANAEKLVGSGELVRKCERETAPRLHRLGHLIVRCGMDLIKKGDMIVAAAKGVCQNEHAPTASFPPFAVCMGDLQQRVDAHDARVQQYLTEVEQFSRPMIALEGVLGRLLPAPLPVPPAPLLGRVLPAPPPNRLIFHAPLGYRSPLCQAVGMPLPPRPQPPQPRPVPPPSKRVRR